MAEAAGLVVGGIALVTLFDSAMNAFDYIDAGASYGREYNRLALQENLLKLRMSRWEEGVRAAMASRGAGREGGELSEREREQVEEAGKLLGEIQATIEDTRVVAERYQGRGSFESKNGEDRVGEKLISRVRFLAKQRQRETGVGKIVRWALRDEKKFRRLVEDLGELVSALEEVFPPQEFPELLLRTKQLALEDAEQLVQPTEIEEAAGDDGEAVVDVLQQATKEVDPVLQDAVEKKIETVRSGHSYKDFKTEASTVHAGNVVQPGNVVSGPAISFERFTTTGGARMHAGDFYGNAKYVLDD